MAVLLTMGWRAFRRGCHLKTQGWLCLEPRATSYALREREIADAGETMLSRADHRRRLMAVSSGGGHWIQLLRVSPAFSDCDVTFVTVNELYRSQVADHRFYAVNDATRWNKLGLIKMALKLAWIVWREKPEVVISTGAAPGYVALRLGRLMGARTIWLDSLANIEQLSMSAQKIGRHADLWLTQWAHLAKPEGPHYAGAVL